MLKYLGIKNVMVTCYPQVDDKNIIYIYTHTYPYTCMYIHKMDGWIEGQIERKQKQHWSKTVTVGESE